MINIFKTLLKFINILHSQLISVLGYSFVICLVQIPSFLTAYKPLKHFNCCF